MSEPVTTADCARCRAEMLTNKVFYVALSIIVAAIAGLYANLWTTTKSDAEVDTRQQQIILTVAEIQRDRIEDRRLFAELVARVEKLSSNMDKLSQIIDWRFDTINKLRMDSEDTEKRLRNLERDMRNDGK